MSDTNESAEPIMATPELNAEEMRALMTLVSSLPIVQALGKLQAAAQFATEQQKELASSNPT